MDKSLVLNSGEYKKWNSTTPSSWEMVSSTLPTQQQFESDGIDSLTPLLDRRVEELEPIQMSNKSDILLESDEGKVFGGTIDLKKYFDIRSMKVEVK